jgi:hypothetical protein
MVARSAAEMGKLWTTLSCATISLQLISNAESLGAAAATAANSWAALLAGFGTAASGREKSRDANSARDADSSKSALYMRCCIAFCRRMSMMTASRGLRFTMYVKFCSGPTPR